MREFLHRLAKVKAALAPSGPSATVTLISGEKCTMAALEAFKAILAGEVQSVDDEHGNLLSAILHSEEETDWDNLDFPELLAKEEE